MEPLEVVLRKVEDLRRDLSAEIPEEGHYESYPIIEEVSGGGFAGASSNIGRVETGEFEERWLVDKSAEPDEQKREAARAELQRVYDSSEWYSARYAAGRDLDINIGEPSSKLSIWIQELRQNLKVTKREVVERVEETKDVYHRGVGGGDSREGIYPEPTGRIIDVYGNVPNVEERLNAIKDTRELFKLSNSENVRCLLQETYNFNNSRQVREQAGKYLGKSRLSLWFHELGR